MKNKIIVLKHIVIAAIMVSIETLVGFIGYHIPDLSDILYGLLVIGVFYYVPFFFITLLYDLLIFNNIKQKAIRYALGVNISLFIFLYHIGLGYIRKGVILSANEYDIKLILSFILMWPIGVFLCEKLFSNKDKI